MMMMMNRLLSVLLVLLTITSSTRAAIRTSTTTTNGTAATTTPTTNGTTPTTTNATVTSIGYTDKTDGTELEGFMSVPNGGGLPSSLEPTTPAVIIVPDWDGIDEYEKIRANMVSKEFGYVAFVADIYGTAQEQPVENRTERSELANKYRSDPELFASRIQSAIDTVRIFPEVNATEIAIVGYCFGGTGVLTYGLLGMNDVQAIVSFHGGLTSLPNETALTKNVTPQILVLSGGDDDTSTDIMDLEITLDQSNATSWEITRYSDIQHAFTKFDDERYNEWADHRSWYRTQEFLKEVFGEQQLVESNPPATINVEPVPYTDIDGTKLQGYVTVPNTTKWATPSPIVLILPDWDGVNEYEQKRATLLAELGYVAFAADIYGAGKQNNLTFDERRELTTMYRSNSTLFVQRINRAIQEATAIEGADPDNVAVIGYCFGGTGVIELAFSDNIHDVKVVASFHGGLRTLPNATNTTNTTASDNKPYVLILSGGDDDAHGNQTILESALNSIDADWEISRYSGVVHGFTKWTAGDAYSSMADTRSWDSMLSTFDELLDGPEPLASSVTDDDDSNTTTTNGADEDPSTSSAITPFPSSLLLSFLALISSYCTMLG